MNINIIVKPSFSILIPETELLDLESANQLAEKIQEQKVAGNTNFIIDLHHCSDMDYAVGNVLMELHDKIYEHAGSLVFCELNDTVLQKIKKEQLHLTLNFTPTFVEAVDMVNMESLERDLYNE